MLLHDLLHKSAMQFPKKNALGHKKQWFTYQTLQLTCETSARALYQLTLEKGDRVAIYLPKSEKAVISYFSTSQAGGIFIPINPVLKAQQVLHILYDSTAKILITNKVRLVQLVMQTTEKYIAVLKHIIVIDNIDDEEMSKIKQLINKGDSQSINIINWTQFIQLGNITELTNESTIKSEVSVLCKETIKNALDDTNLAAIFYTSGSTGKAKGVVLSHRNLVMGAKSVVQYLPSKSSDIMAAIQPFSFDYGFSQLTICFYLGASCYIEEFLFEQDLFETIVSQKITTLALVPPLWIKLAESHWPAKAGNSIRYFCNTGGAMPISTLTELRKKMPNAQPYLMYGLTEAFRSCYLPPDQIDIRPTSFGKAIPNAQIFVINDQGDECQPHEPGELVHAGVLVSQGYWNNKEKTAERFKAVPCKEPLTRSESKAVWSGDLVKKDEEGFLYFIGRKDEQIKSSGYRISPDEVESVLYLLDELREAVVIGVAHPTLGQALVAIIVAKSDLLTEKKVLQHCSKLLPQYMLPKHVSFVESLPRNPNKKFDRKYWQIIHHGIFDQPLELIESSKKVD